MHFSLSQKAQSLEFPSSRLVCGQNSPPMVPSASVPKTFTLLPPPQSSVTLPHLPLPTASTLPLPPQGPGCLPASAVHPPPQAGTLRPQPAGPSGQPCTQPL